MVTSSQTGVERQVLRGGSFPSEWLSYLGGEGGGGEGPGAALPHGPGRGKSTQAQTRPPSLPPASGICTGTSQQGSPETRDIESERTLDVFLSDLPRCHHERTRGGGLGGGNKT